MDVEARKTAQPVCVLQNAKVEPGRYAQPEAQFGHIYIFESRGLYKLGKTLQLKSRLLSHVSSSAFLDVHFLLICPAEELDSVDRELLSLFKPKRSHMEWFALDAGDLDWFRQNPLPLYNDVCHSLGCPCCGTGYPLDPFSFGRRIKFPRVQLRDSACATQEIDYEDDEWDDNFIDSRYVPVNEVGNEMEG